MACTTTEELIQPMAQTTISPPITTNLTERVVESCASSSTQSSGGESHVHQEVSSGEQINPRQEAEQAYRDFMGRFKVMHKLNEGGMAIAHCATDTMTGKLVALKHYRLLHGARIEGMHRQRKSYANEHRILSDVTFLSYCKQSDHIIKLIDSFGDERIPSRATLVLELAEHGDLQDYWQAACRSRYQTPEPLLWHWLLQMAKAVHFLHDTLGENAIIHCDIKPENWLVTRPQQSSPLYPTHGTGQLPINAYPDIKLTDFDLARFERGVGWDEGVSRGSPATQPPEYPRDSKASDIWAVGVCIHYLAGCSYPIVPPKHGYRDMSPVDVAQWEVDAPRKVVNVTTKGYSKQLRDVLQGSKTKNWRGKELSCNGGMLNFDVEERWTATELLEKVERIVVEDWNGEARDYRLDEWAFPLLGRQEPSEEDVEAGV